MDPNPAVPMGSAGTLPALRRLVVALGVHRRRTVLSLALLLAGAAWITTSIARREARNAVRALPATKSASARQIRAAAVEAQAARLRLDLSATGANAGGAAEQPPPSPLARRAKAALKADKKTFGARLRFIIGVCFPTMRCKEMINTVLLCVLLVSRTVLSIIVAITMGHAAGAIVGADWPGFIRTLRRFALIGVPASLVNSGIKYQTAILSLRFQRRLTDSLNVQYVTGVNFYKASELPEFKIDNIDQRVTTDIEKFCEQGTEMFCKIFKPLLDVSLNTWQLGRDVGARGPAIIIGYFALAVAAKIAIMPDFKGMVKKKSELAGNYRTAHARLINNAEEIAFYEGGSRERSIIRQRFGALYWHTRLIATKTAAVSIVDTWIEKYGASIAGFVIMCLPIFFSSRVQSVAQNTNDFIKRRAIMTDLANGLGSLLVVGTQLKMLTGTTARVSEVFELVKQLNESGTKRFEIMRDDEPATVQNGDVTTRPIVKSQSMLALKEMEFLFQWRERGAALRKQGKLHCGRGESDSPRGNILSELCGKVEVGPTIKFDRVQLVSPDGRHLIKQPLHFEIPLGANVMVAGPNGCGKSSLFRVLGELWPPYSGVVTKPAKADIMFVPQRPYLVMGTLRDQITYPDSAEVMRAKSVTDADLTSLLALVDPPGTILSRWDFDHETNWSLTLSGGQKQRVAMARMFYHLPTYAILDECTSAVSDDVTDKIYETCANLGITLFTIAHQKTVIKHHKLVLRFDGKGGWKLQSSAQDPMWGDRT